MYKDDLEAAHARVASLESKLNKGKSKKEKTKAKKEKIKSGFIKMIENYKEEIISITVIILFFVSIIAVSVLIAKESNEKIKNRDSICIKALKKLKGNYTFIESDDSLKLNDNLIFLNKDAAFCTFEKDGEIQQKVFRSK